MSGDLDFKGLIVDHFIDFISVHTLDGIYLYASDSATELIGYKPEELINHSAYEFFHPDEIKKVQTAHSSVIKTPDVFTTKYRIRRKDGVYIWVETRSKTIENGHRKYIINHTRDVRDEIALNQQVDGVLKFCHYPVCIFDNDCKIKKVNPAFPKAFGYSTESYLRRNLCDFIERNYQDDFLSSVRRAYSGSHSFKTYFRTKKLGAVRVTCNLKLLHSNLLLAICIPET